MVSHSCSRKGHVIKTGWKGNSSAYLEEKKWGWGEGDPWLLTWGITRQGWKVFNLIVNTELHQKSSGPVLSTDHSSNINNYAYIWKKYGHIWFLPAFFPLPRFPGITHQGLAHQAKTSVTPLVGTPSSANSRSSTPKKHHWAQMSFEFVLPIRYLRFL